MTGTAKLRMAILLAVIAGLALVPFVVGEFYLLLMTKIAALAILAISLDLLLGYSGMISFGHAAFLGVGAYAGAMLAPEYEAANMLITLPLSIAAATLVAFLIGVLAIRTSGIYFIMVTLAFAQMAFYVAHDTPFFGGSDGRLIFSKPQVRLGDMVLADLSGNEIYYYTTLGFLIVSYLCLTMIVRSPFGQIIQGIKSNEQRMRALGFPTAKYRLASFVIAGAFAGLAGYLLAYQAEYVSPAMLGWQQSGLLLMMVILGGSGTLWGPAVGAFLLIAVEEFLADLTGHWMGLMGLFIVLIVIFLPHGLAGLAARIYRPTEAEVDDD